MEMQDRILIVGAGPVGLVTATALVTEGIPVVIFEAEKDIPEDLRASTFHPPTLDFLHRYGITASIIEQGRICPLWQFRDRQEGVVATFDLAALKDETGFPYRVQCEQWKLTRLLRKRLAATPGVEIVFGAKAIDVGQDQDRVRLTVQQADGGKEAVEGRYLVGADGARSAIRKAVGVAFEGFTMPEAFLSISTPFPYHEVIPELADIAYISDPDEWVTLLRTPTLWRVLFPTHPDETEAEMMAPERIEQRLQSLLPSATPYEVVHKTSYRVHERVVAKYVHGRVILAGDAAHLNNPLGGMGMNGGIHDAINLAGKLIEVWRGRDPSYLDLYERQRRKVALETVQTQALRNKQILSERDPEKREAFYRELRKTADNPKTAFEYLMRSSMIQSLRDIEAIT